MLFTYSIKLGFFSGFWCTILTIVSLPEELTELLAHSACSDPILVDTRTRTYLICKQPKLFENLDLSFKKQRNVIHN